MQICCHAISPNQFLFVAEEMPVSSATIIQMSLIGSDRASSSELFAPILHQNPFNKSILNE